MKNIESPFRLRAVVVALAGLAFALFILIVAQNLSPSPTLPWLQSLLENIGTTIMVAATVGLLFDSITRKDLLNMLDGTKQSIAEQIRTFRALDELGLVDAYSDVNTYSYNDLVLSGKEFIAVVNDGRSWLTRNAGCIRKRMLLPDCKTVFIFQHPESEMLDVLSHKVQQQREFIQQKIADTVNELNSYERASNHELIILGHKYFNVHSIFMNEDYIAYTPYLLSPGRNTIPVFVFEKRGQAALYQRWYTDVQQLIRVSEPLVPVTYT